MTLADKPARGSALRRPDMEVRRAEIAEIRRRLDLERRMRNYTVDRLINATEGARHGMRLDIVARHLRELADDLEQLPARVAAMEP